METKSFLQKIESQFLLLSLIIGIFCLPISSLGEEEPVSQINYIPTPSLSLLWGDAEGAPASESDWEERVGLSLDRWDSISGNTVSHLTDSHLFYSTPSGGMRLDQSSLSTQEAAQFPIKANGLRIRGLLIIPEDGEYTFALASDDGAELWLGKPGGSRFTKEKALSCPSWTSPENWNTHRTVARSYKAGDIIWIETLSKNGGGAQHVSIAWRRPGESTFSAIPSTLEDGTIVLSCPPPDPEDPYDIGVPQSWLSSVGLGGLSPAIDPRVRLYRDTDGDGFNLLREYQTGGRPDEWGGNRGYMGLERWNNVTGGNLKSFVKTEQFSQPPHTTEPYSGSLDIAPSGNYYAARTRSLLQVPRGGQWTFYIAGDDDAWLLLSSDESRFHKRRIAKTNGYTGRYEWTKNAFQKSDPLTLQVGQRYFLETLLYQITGFGGVAVAWEHTPENLCQRPGVTATQSSQYGAGLASLAIDGDRSTHNHTNSTGSPSWLEVDFGTACDMNQVVIYNRTDATNGRRLANFRIQVLDEAGNEIIGEDFFTEPGTWAGAVVTWDIPQTVRGRKVRIQQLGKNGHNNYYLHVKEIEVYEQTEFSQGPVVIDSRFVYTIPAEADDEDNNSIPDSWQREKGLVPGQNGLSALDCAEYGDPDNDLAANQVEYLLSTNPLVPSGIPGYMTRELWRNIPGWSVDDSMKFHSVLAPATSRDLIKGTNAPRNIGDDYHQRLRGTIIPPVSGEYTFWISSDETSVLYLSTDDRKFSKREIARVGYSAADRGVYLAKYNEWDAFPRQRSIPVRLEAGKEYFIEAQHKQYHAINHLQIAWQMPGGQRELIPEEYIRSFGGDLADRDDDDLPDDWEEQYGISSADNGHGNYDNGAWGDPWNHGITNREAYLRGWDPRAPSLPQPGQTLVDIPVTGGTPIQGSWSTVGTGIITPMGRGTISYTASIPTPDNYQAGTTERYLLEITAKPGGNVLEVETIDISVTANGQSLGARTLRSLQGAEGKVHFLLPPLSPGNLDIRLTMNNNDLRRTFQITGMRLIRPDQVGEDNSWLQQYLNKENAVTRCPRESLVSPVCVEGRARDLYQTRMTMSTPGRAAASATLLPLSGGAWYAYADLPADGADLTLSTSFESNALTTETTAKWIPCDLLLQGNMTLARGASIRACIGGAGEGTTAFPVTYTVTDAGGATATHTASSNTPVALTFSTPGIHTVTAAWQGEDGEDLNTQMTVKALDPDLGGMMDLITGMARTVTLENIPEELLLTANTPLRADKALGTTAATTRKLDIYSEKGGAQYLAARLGADGPILKTKPFFSHDNTGSSTLSRIEIVREFGDGSSLICLYLASESLPEGGYVTISLTAAGVQFLEGGTQKRLYASDFGPDGLARILMTSPSGTATSVCHRIRYYTAEGQQL